MPLMRIGSWLARGRVTGKESRMPIAVEQLRERLEEKPKAATLSRFSQVDERVRFNVVADLDGGNSYKSRFLRFCTEQISKEAEASFKGLLRPPYPSVSLFDKAFSALSKVFDAKDANVSVEFESEDDKKDWASYQSNNLGDIDSVQRLFFEKMKTCIHSAVVVDMDSEVSEPRPYINFIPPEGILDYECDGQEMLWLVWMIDDERIGVVDDTSYRVFSAEGRTLSNPVPIVENFHQLGRCPARWLWSDEVDGLKKHPILNHLSDADWYLFYKTAAKYTETFAAMPMIWGYDDECDYELNGSRCEGGFLYDDHGPVITNGAPMSCPKCSSRKLGAGTFIRVTQPDSMEGIADMRDPVGFIQTPVEALNYVDAKLERLEKSIYEGITGHGGDPSKTQAMNVEQILASVDSRKTILMGLKKNFESIHKWVLDTICSLRYGNQYGFTYVNYGQHFYFFEPEQLLKMYQEARKEGLDDVILDELRDEYNDAKYRNSPEQGIRVKILENIDPFRHRSRDEVMSMAVDEGLKILKLNFSSLIARFERENGSVVQFGSLLDMDARVRRIREILLRYVGEMLVIE